MPIPYMMIVEYALLHEFTAEQREDLLYYVRRMDSAFLKWYESKHGRK